MKFQDVLLSPKGRINRQPYWIATLVMIAAGFIASLIPLVNLLFVLFSVYVYVCLYNKRLHDLGKSGWLQMITWVAALVAFGAMIAAFVPVMMAIMNGAEDERAIMAAMMGSMGAFAVICLASLVNLVFHICLGVVAGEPGANTYGPAPLDPVAAEVLP